MLFWCRRSEIKSREVSSEPWEIGNSYSLRANPVALIREKSMSFKHDLFSVMSRIRSSAYVIQIRSQYKSSLKLTAQPVSRPLASYHLAYTLLSTHYLAVYWDLKHAIEGMCMRTSLVRYAR